MSCLKSFTLIVIARCNPNNVINKGVCWHVENFHTTPESLWKIPWVLLKTSTATEIFRKVFNSTLVLINTLWQTQERTTLSSVGMGDGEKTSVHRWHEAAWWTEAASSPLLAHSCVVIVMMYG